MSQKHCLAPALTVYNDLTSSVHTTFQMICLEKVRHISVMMRHCSELCFVLTLVILKKNPTRQLDPPLLAEPAAAVVVPLRSSPESPSRRVPQR